jgi:hypothetical protein
MGKDPRFFIMQDGLLVLFGCCSLLRRCIRECDTLPSERTTLAACCDVMTEPCRHNNHGQWDICVCLSLCFIRHVTFCVIILLLSSHKSYLFTYQILSVTGHGRKDPPNPKSQCKAPSTMAEILSCLSLRHMLDN